MTVNSTTATASYTGNGVTQLFPIPFYFLLDTDLKVSKKVAVTGVTTVLALNSGYTVSGSGNPSGGTLTLLAVPANGDQIFIERNIAFVQQTAYPENNKFPSASHEKALDRDTMGLQQLDSKLSRALVRDPLGTTYDLGANRLVNGGNAIDANDVPNLAQTQALIAATAAGVLPTLIPFKSDIIQVLPNVAAIASYPKIFGATMIYTRGYYTPGDGGHGYYRYDPNDTTTVSDGVLTHVANDGARWKLQRESGMVNLKQGGCRGDATGVTGVGTDDTARLQATINAVGQGVIFVPKGIFRTTAQITIGTATKIVGEGYGITRITNTTNPSPIVGGSWFYFDHAGIGFFLSSTDNGGLFRSIATVRNQPTSLTSGWTPNNNDFDFSMNPATVEWTWENVMLQNPSLGFSLSNRARLTNVRGQPFKIGIYVDNSADTCRFESIHWWPYWADNTFVNRYCMNNLAMYQFLRCDNPTLLNCFGIFARYGIRVQQGAAGTTSKMRVTSCDFDATGTGIIVETGANNATMYLDNVPVQAESVEQLFGTALFVQANNCRIYASNFSSIYGYQGGVRIEGTGNIAVFSNLEVRDSDRGNVGYNAVYVGAGNVAKINGTSFGNTISTAAYIAGPGDIQVRWPTRQTTGTTDANGVINVTHNLGCRPNAASFQMVSDASLTYAVTATSATTVTVKFRNAQSGAPLASTALNFYYTPEDVFPA